jgi:hypothetical protein
VLSSPSAGVGVIMIIPNTNNVNDNIIAMPTFFTDLRLKILIKSKMMQIIELKNLINQESFPGNHFFSSLDIRTLWININK